MLDGEFKNLAVVSVQEAENLGAVEGYSQIDTKTQRTSRRLLLRGGMFPAVDQ